MGAGRKKYGSAAPGSAGVPPAKRAEGALKTLREARLSMRATAHIIRAHALKAGRTPALPE